MFKLVNRVRPRSSLQYSGIIFEDFTSRLRVMMNVTWNMDMSGPSHNHLIAVTQMQSTNDKNKNLTIVKDLVGRAASRGAEMVFLPEGCDYIGESKKETLDLAETEDDPILASYCQMAGSLKIWMSVGGMHIKAREDDEIKVSNTHFIIDNFGNVRSKYSKCHLFSVSIPEQKINLQESSYVLEGSHIVPPVQSPCGSVALGICYDMRFPEFSLLHRKAGAEILTFPSAFTVPTGLAHWHSLLKARAIETQCYVVAAAQTGQHNSKRSSYGHALVVDPWGTVVVEVSEGNSVAFAEVDLKYLKKIRKEMPVFNHRRTDLYCLKNVQHSTKPGITELLGYPKDFVTYPFGRVSLPGSCIFLQTSSSHSFVNKKPFCDGHVLISPQKLLKRFCDLTDWEISDLSQAVVLTLIILFEKYSPLRVQMAIQDGKFAGQTIEHVHVHLIPQMKEDSGLLENHETKDSARKWRTDEDMAQEASILRQHTMNLLRNNNWLSSSYIPRVLQYLDPKTRGIFQVNNIQIPGSKIFLYTGGCFAFLPGNQILPGHVCVCFCKEVSTLSDASSGEISDLFLSLRDIQIAVEGYVGTSSSTIYVESSLNGKSLCAHLLPRNEKDFESNDDVYKVLNSFELEAPDNSQDELLSILKNRFTFDIY